MDYSFDEIKGLERQLELLISKANRIRASLAVENDPSVKFKLEHDLTQAEAEIREVKTKLSEKYNFHTSEGGTVLEEKIKRLNIEEKIGTLHLVNCDREGMKDRFWNEFDERNEEHFQFYFISACPTQMPPSFSERMIYEIIIEELDERLDAMHCRRKDGSDRVKIHDLPVGRKLDRCQDEFRKFFSTYFEFREGVTFEDYIRTGIPHLGYKYVVMVFEIRESQWKDFLPEYFKWLIDTFSDTHEDVPKFLFFFVLYQENLHEDCESEAKKAILDPVRKLVSDHHSAALLTPLEPVPETDLKDWLMGLGERNHAKIEEVIETMVKGLKDKDLAQYRERKRLNMDDIERLQEIIYKIVNKR